MSGFQTSYKEINQNLLSKFFLSLLTTEKSLDELRKTLSTHKMFDGYSLFKCIDKKGNGYIQLQDLADLLNSQEFYMNSKQAAALFCCLDFDKNAILNYMEFLNSIIPKKFNRPTKPICYEYCSESSNKNNQDFDIDFILKDLSTL